MAVAVSHSLPDDVPSQLQIVADQHGTTVTLVVTGDWDLAAHAATQATIEAALASRPERVILDVSGLSFIDSTGIHDVIELYERSRLQNAQLEIIPGSPVVHRPFEICGLIDVLPFRSAP